MKTQTKKLGIIMAVLVAVVVAFAAMTSTASAARPANVIVADFSLTETQMLSELTELYQGNSVAAQGYLNEFGPGERDFPAGAAPRALDVIAIDPFLSREQAIAEMTETYRGDRQAAVDYYETFSADLKRAYALDPIFHPGNPETVLGRGACCLTSDDVFYLYLP